MNINSPEVPKDIQSNSGGNFTTPIISSSAFNKPVKRKKTESLDEENSLERIEELTIEIRDMLTNPILIMGMLEIFLDNAPDDVSVNYKSFNIKLSIDTKKDAAGIDLNKYIRNKFN